MLAIAFFVVSPHGAPGPAMRDFEAFYAAGATANADEDPYGRAIWKAERAVPGVDSSHDETLPFVGPPALLPLWRTLALLPYAAAGRVWGALLAAAMLVTIFGSLALARAPRKTWIVLGAAIFASAFGPLTSDVALGQFALVCAAAIVLTLLLLSTRAWLAASLAAAIAALQPNLCLVLVARTSDLRALVAFAVSGIAFTAAMLQSGGIAGILRYVQLLSVHGAAEATTVIQITPAGVALGFGANTTIVSTVRWSLAAGALLCAAFAVRRVDDPVARVGISACALPFIVPFFHEHDFILTLMPALFCVVRARGRILAFAAVSASACAVDWLSLGQRPDAAVQAVVLASTSALGFCLAAEMRPRAFAGLAVPAVVALVALWARAHPVPIWPDALPAHWQAPPGAGISDVWALEQRVAGLDAQTPAWSALRTISLAASALLGLATYRVSRSHVPVEVPAGSLAYT